MSLKKALISLNKKLKDSPLISTKIKIKFDTYRNIEKICNRAKIKRIQFFEAALNDYISKFDYELIDKANKNLASNDNNKITHL